jgi:Ca2+/Na+ antiporter
LAKKGYGEMAIAGSIAGPLFNVLVGLGISLIRKNIIR